MCPAIPAGCLRGAGDLAGRSDQAGGHPAQVIHRPLPDAAGHSRRFRASNGEPTQTLSHSRSHEVPGGVLAAEQHHGRVRS